MTRRHVSIRWLNDSVRSVEALAAIHGADYHIPPTTSTVRVDVTWHGQVPTLRLYCDAEPGSAACAKALRAALAASTRRTVCASCGRGTAPPYYGQRGSQPWSDASATECAICADAKETRCGSCADWTPFSECVNTPSGAAVPRDEDERDCGYCGSSRSEAMPPRMERRLLRGRKRGSMKRSRSIELPDPKPGDIVEGDDGALFRVSNPWPCAVLPADLESWKERIGMHQIACLRPDGSRQALIVLRTGGAELTVFDRERSGSRLVQLSVLTRPGTPEEAARLALRAASLLGLVRLEKQEEQDGR